MSYVFEERYDVYDETPRRARTAKPCGACARTIAVGEIYMRVAWIFDGHAESVNRCGACQATHQHLRNLGEADVWPDERLGCGQDYEEEWGAVPDEIAALPFLSGAEASAKLEGQWQAEARGRAERRALRAAALAREAER